MRSGYETHPKSCEPPNSLPQLKRLFKTTYKEARSKNRVNHSIILEDIITKGAVPLSNLAKYKRQSKRNTH